MGDMMRSTPMERQLKRLVTAADLDLQAAERAMPATRGDMHDVKNLLKDIRDIMQESVRVSRRAAQPSRAAS